MANPVEWISGLLRAGKERGGAVVGGVRQRRPWVDHAIRTWQRYQECRADQLAGAVTYFAFLSFFPLIALAFAIVGYAVTVSPHAGDLVRQALNEYVPGLATRLPIDQIAAAKKGAGIIGLLGLLYAGLGWIDALRDALRQVWLHGSPRPNFLLAKASDLLTLVLLGGALIMSTLLNGTAAAATHLVLDWLNLQDSAVAEFVLRMTALGVSVSADMIVFLVLFGRISGAREPITVLLRGAVFGAVGLALLKLLGTFLLGHTTGNPIYGTFAVMVGLLVWIDITVRFILLAAAWTATSTKGPAPEPTPVPMADEVTPEPEEAGGR
ncbi:YihY/virulence factor BrkB family protein [Bailinhaonella thermotolerans]|uniref:YihY/virulence factor BrkB family protein n=1 Tax=Bailinhaonella thermotolerans TaxID=1070861 RepID=UPI001F5BFF36|nr:YihY/virulence factor BrkB family protein [Bailinhaonella thermotolerans]